MKDILFTIYKYNISKEKYIEGDAFKENTPIGKSDSEYFEKQCFGSKDSKIILREIIVRSGTDASLKRKGVESSNKEEHIARILEHKDGIIIIQIQANKTKTLHDENFYERPVDDHPPFLIIIDNRPGYQYLAIQQGVMNIGKVAKMLVETFNYNMAKREHRFNILNLRKKMSFHDTIFHMKERLGRRVTKIAFEFDKKEKTVAVLPKKMESFIKNWIGKFADEGKIETTISNDENLNKRSIARDFELLATLCLENPKYKLSAWFGNFGLYRYGKDFGAQFGLSSDVLSAFLNPPAPTPKELQIFQETEEEKIPSLTEWLNKLKVVFDDYEKTPLSISGRGRRNRRAL